MAIQILNDPYATIGSGLGYGLAQGAQSGVQQALDLLAQSKARELTQRRTASGLGSLGISQQEAQQLALLPPEILREVVKQKLEAPQQQAFAQGLAALLGGGTQPSPQQAESILENGELPQLDGMPPQGPASPLEALGQTQTIPAMQEQAVSRLEAMGGAQAPSPMAALGSLGGLKKQDALALAKLAIKKQAESQAQELAREKLRFQKEQAKLGREAAEKKEETRIAEESRKQYKPALEKIREKGERASKDIDIYRKLSALNESGKLIQGRSASAKKLASKVPWVGGISEFFTNPSTQLAEKLTSELALGAGSAFNTPRMTNFQLETYAKTIPSLLNSKEGMRAIIREKTLEAKANKARAKAAGEVLSEYEGRKLPDNIFDRIDERAQPQIEKYARKALDSIYKAIGLESPSKASEEWEDGAIAEDRSGNRWVLERGKWKPEGK